MPLYDYACEGGHKFDRFMTMADRHNPQTCTICGKGARRLISAPRLRADAIEPCLGMDGKMHDSLASYRRTLLPDGNPKGERYIELGHEEIMHAPPQFDPRQRRDDIRKAIADVKAGNVPPIPQGPPT